MNLTSPQGTAFADDMSARSGWRLIELPEIGDPRGNLTFIENRTHLPFDIAEVRWIYDIPSGTVISEEMSGINRQLIVCLSGRFELELKTAGDVTQRVALSSPSTALLVGPAVMVKMIDFATNSVALLLDSVASGNCRPADDNSIRHYDWHRVSGVDDCPLIDLGRSALATGGCRCASETIVENGRQVPFDVRRVYYLYDVPADSERGGHSHRQHHEVLVAVAGSVDVELYDGVRRRMVRLNRPWTGLQIIPGIWRVLNNFSAGSVLLVLTSHPYSEADYVRTEDEFRELTCIKTYNPEP